MEHGGPNRGGEESRKEVLETAGLGGEDSLIKVDALQDIDSPCSASRVPEISREQTLHDGSTGKIRLGTSKGRKTILPSDGQIEREEVPQKDDPSRDVQAEKTGGEPEPAKSSKMPAYSNGSREGDDFSADAPETIHKSSALVALPVRETPPEESAPRLLPPSSTLTNFPSLAHSKVEDSIDFFQNRAGGFFARALGRSTTYAEMMKRIFREKNLPEELFYLALIESGFNPKAFSRARASGIWQFVGITAKRFGLKVDKWVDERRDPEKATYAAAEYLKNLYSMFNDWDLAAASYNAGEGRILKAMKKANSQDFWRISQERGVKKETKEYVPMFLAAVTIAQSPHKYGFQNIEYSPPLVYEKVTVPPSTSLVVIAKASGEDLSSIQALNPALKKGKTPPHSSFDIKLPSGKKEIFERNFQSCSKLSVKNKKHRVRKGENLVNIAQKYHLALIDLCDMNDLAPKDRVKPGTLLLLPPA